MTRLFLYYHCIFQACQTLLYRVLVFIVIVISKTDILTLYIFRSYNSLNLRVEIDRCTSKSMIVQNDPNKSPFKSKIIHLYIFILLSGVRSSLRKRIKFRGQIYVVCCNKFVEKCYIMFHKIPNRSKKRKKYFNMNFNHGN